MKLQCLELMLEQKDFNSYYFTPRQTAAFSSPSCQWSQPYFAPELPISFDFRLRYYTKAYYIVPRQIHKEHCDYNIHARR